MTMVRLRRDSAKGLRRMNSCEAKCESALAKQNHLEVPRALACAAPFKDTAFMGKGLLGKKGFTLLEMVVTMALMVSGIAAMIRLVGITISVEAGVERAATGCLLAQEKMEEIKGAGSYAAIDGFASPRAALTGNYAGFERAVGVSGDPKQVTVTVYWQLDGQERNVSLVSLMTNYDF